MMEIVQIVAEMVEGKEMLLKLEFQKEPAWAMVFNSDLEVDVDEINGGMALSSSMRTVQLQPECIYANTSSGIARGGHELVCLDTTRGRWDGHEFLKIMMKY